MSAPAVDVARLAEVADGDDAFLAELVETLLASTGAARDELVSAAGDAARLARIGHRLSGMAGSAHADLLRAAAQRLERRAVDSLDDARALAAAVGATTDALDRTIAEVGDWWRKRGGG